MSARGPVHELPREPVPSATRLASAHSPEAMRVLTYLIHELELAHNLPAPEQMLRLGELCDSGHPESAMALLRAARTLAAEAALSAAGSQVALARQLGVTRGTVQRALTPHPQRHQDGAS